MKSINLNELALNAKKTKMMVFHYKQKCIQNLIPKLKINNVFIEQVEEFNFLGVTIDEHITWKQHSQKVASKIACTIGTMKRLKYFLPTTILKTLYNSLILPHLQYGILLWGKQSKRVPKLQKWALRTIENSKYNAHTDPILKRLKLLKVNDLYNLSAIKFYHKYANNKLPKFFDNFFSSNQTTHDHNTRHKNTRRDSPSTISASQSPRYAITKVIDGSLLIQLVFLPILFKALLGTIKRPIFDSYPLQCSIQSCYICNRD